MDSILWPYAPDGTMRMNDDDDSILQPCFGSTIPIFSMFCDVVIASDLMVKANF